MASFSGLQIILMIEFVRIIMNKILLGAAFLMASVGVANATVSTVTHGDNTFTFSSESFTGTIEGKYVSSNLKQGWDQLDDVISNASTGWAFNVDRNKQYSIDSLDESSSKTISGNHQPFDYFSLHAGNNTIFFKFSQTLSADTPFTISTTGNGAGLSNLHGFSAVSPVPEAEEWAMMLVGLGLIGVAANRKPAVDNSIKIKPITA